MRTRSGPWWEWQRLAVLLGMAALAGCSDTISVAPGLPGVPVPDMVRVVKAVDRPTNLIERGLSDCDRGRTAAGETGCLKDALAAAHTGLAELVRMIPGCKPGVVCRYTYTTVDRVGFVPATQTRFSVRWQVDFDLRKSVKTVVDVPVTIVSL